MLLVLCYQEWHVWYYATSTMLLVQCYQEWHVVAQIA